MTPAPSAATTPTPAPSPRIHTPLPPAPLPPSPAFRAGRAAYLRGEPIGFCLGIAEAVVGWTQAQEDYSRDCDDLIAAWNERQDTRAKQFNEEQPAGRNRSEEG